MLVLSRKAGQGVVIGNSIRITVIELSAGMVRLGFDAPSDVSIYRDEIYAEIAKANQAALDPAGSQLGGTGEAPGSSDDET